MRKLVLFDMDGVLYDSMPNHAIAWQKAMESFGIHFTAEDSYATEGARGVDTIRRYVREQQGKDISEGEAQSMYDEKARLFASLPTARLMPGIPELMAAIAADGLAIGVVTGSGQRPLINRILNDLGDFLSPERIVTAYDVKHGKPSPEPYLTGMRKCGDYKPCETVVVENAPLGVRAAHDSGAFTVAVNTGPLSDETLAAQGTDVIYPTIEALKDDWARLSKRHFL